jgi:hypothetical protein
MTSVAIAQFAHRRRSTFFEYEQNGRVIQRPYPNYLADVAKIFERLHVLCDHRTSSNVHGWRRGHSVATAVADISSRHGSRLSFDIVNFFGSIDQNRLRSKINRLDPTMWDPISRYLPQAGIPTGFSFSPLLGNLYLEEVDQRFPAVRYADNIMIVTDEPERCYIKMRRHLQDIGLNCHKVENDPKAFCKSPLPGMRREEVVPTSLFT